MHCTPGVTAHDDQLRAALAEAQARLAASQWRQARVSRVITNALCAVDELTGEPFQRLAAEVRAIAAESLPGGPS